MPRVIQVIECEEKRGTGSPTSPIRYVKCYYTLDGVLLADYDYWRPRETDEEISIRRENIANGTDYSPKEPEESHDYD